MKTYTHKKLGWTVKKLDDEETATVINTSEFEQHEVDIPMELIENSSDWQLVTPEKPNQKDYEIIKMKNPRSGSIHDLVDSSISDHYVDSCKHNHCEIAEVKSTTSNLTWKIGDKTETRSSQPTFIVKFRLENCGIMADLKDGRGVNINYLLKSVSTEKPEVKTTVLKLPQFCVNYNQSICFKDVRDCIERCTNGCCMDLASVNYRNFQDNYGDRSKTQSPEAKTTTPELKVYCHNNNETKEVHDLKEDIVDIQGYYYGQKKEIEKLKTEIAESKNTISILKQDKDAWKECLKIVKEYHHNSELKYINKVAMLERTIAELEYQLKK